MKAMVLAGTGLEALTLREIDHPAEPAPGQVLVRLRAASLNYRDLLVIDGAYGKWTKPDLIPLSDGAGEVAAVGDGVWRAQIGDRVALTFHPHWIGGAYPPNPAMLGRGGAVDGVLAEYSLVSEHELVHLPAHLSFEEGATLPCAAVTAWSALCANAPLLPGESVLVQGTGGVSLFALQLAKLFGARVIATSSSEGKLARLRALGADEVIDYVRTPDWQQRVRTLTDGAGVDRVVEVGGADTLAKSIEATRQTGRISIVGMLGGMPAIDAGFFARGLHFDTIRVGSREHFEQMNRAIAFHGLHPVIDRVFGFAEAPEALRHMQSRAHLGKIVVCIE